MPYSGGEVSNAVLSVSGTQVDNTDPQNPVVRPKRRFTAQSSDALAVSQNILTPSIFPAMTLLGATDFVWDVATGSIRNTGGAILGMTGTLSFQPNVVGGGVGNSVLTYIWSEQSSDGINWTANVNSLRTLEVPVVAESLFTMFSGVNLVPAGNYLRFRMFAAAALNIGPPTAQTIDGALVEGLSMLWELEEV